MNSFLQQQLDQALSEIGAQQKRIQQMQKDLLARTATVRSKDRMLSATVVSGGALTKVEFHDERYRGMAKAELADAIVKVVTEAQQEMTKQVNEVVAPERGNLDKLRESMQDGSQWSEFLAPLLKMRQQATNIQERGDA